MKTYRSTTLRKVITSIIILFISVNLFSQFPEAITKATRLGNADELSKYFNNKIELVLPQKSEVFSNAQAKLVLSDFFKDNPVNSFKIIHQGIRENSSFAIGKYISGNTAYRFYFLTKTKDNKTYIHQLRIEKEK